MPDADLIKSLSALRPPLASEAARERALHRATLAFAAARHTPPDSAPEPVPRHRARLVPAGFLATVAAAVLLLGAGFWMTPPSRIVASGPDSAADSAAQSRDLLAELNTLFPGQLNAVIDRDGVLQLDLAATSHTSPAVADQAILVELLRDGRILRILAYSGRTVRLELDGVSLRLDPLLTSAGDVLLAGDDFVWSSARPAVAIDADSLAGWQIAARPLALPL